MTRAKTDLFLLRALRRRSWAAGESDETEPSRFLLEVPENLIERLGETTTTVEPRVSDGGWSYEPVEEVRFARIEELLRTTSLPIGQIAEIGGFSDPLYFSRAFRKHFGTPPSGLRQGVSPI